MAVFFDSAVAKAPPPFSPPSIAVSNTVIPETWETDSWTQTIQLTNNSKVEQSIDLIASGCCGNMQFEPRKLKLEPGQTTPVNISLALRETCQSRSVADHFDINAKFDVSAKSSLGTENITVLLTGRVNHVFHSSKIKYDLGCVPASEALKTRLIELKESSAIASMTAALSSGDMTASVMKIRTGVWQLALGTVPNRPLGRRESDVLLSINLENGKTTTLSVPVELEYVDDYLLAENTLMQGAVSIGKPFEITFTFTHRSGFEFDLADVGQLPRHVSVVGGGAGVPRSKRQSITLRISPRELGHCSESFRVSFRDLRGNTVEKNVPCYYYAVAD